MTEFMDDLQSVINRHSKENGSGTPDFIIASFLADALKAFEVGVNDRERWYGREQDRFGMPTGSVTLRGDVNTALPFDPPNTEELRAGFPQEVIKTVVTEGDSITGSFKVIMADYGIKTKVVGLLDRSTDEVAWMTDWVETRRSAPPMAYQLIVTKFDGFGTPNIFETFIYGVRL